MMELPSRTEPEPADVSERNLESITVVAVREHVSCDLDGEAVVLHLGQGAYYGLNPVGSRVWSLIQTPMRVSDVRDTLIAEYEVEPQVCERDLRALLDDLVGRGLIELTRS